jgi:P4 family phage/plasmid primase-like protien
MHESFEEKILLCQELSIKYPIFPISLEKEKLHEIKSPKCWTNDELINLLNEEYPDFGIGLSCGAKSRITAVQITLSETSDGMKSWIKFTESHGINSSEIDILTILLEGKGLYLLFRFPHDCSYLPTWFSSEYSGLKIFGSGEMIVLPPSIHLSGEKYFFGGDYHEYPDLYSESHDLPKNLKDFLLNINRQQDNSESELLNIISEFCKKNISRDVLNLLKPLLSDIYSNCFNQKNDFDKLVNRTQNYWKKESLKTVRDVTELILKDYGFVLEAESDREILRHYNGKFWEEYPPNRIKKIIRNEYAKNCDPGLYNNTVKDLLIQCYQDTPIDWFQSEQHHIHLKDYTWDCKNDCKVEYKPEFYIKSILPFNFNPNAKCPTWDKCLLDWFGCNGTLDQDSVALLHEFMGYVLTQRQLLKKGLTLKGHKDSGKTLISHVIQKLVGISNIAFSKLNTIDKSDFGKEKLPNKMLLIDDEPKNKKLDEAVIKELINNEPIVEINPKGDKAFNTKLICKVMILANELKCFEGFSNAALDRLLILPFDNQIPPEKQDPDLLKKLEPELEGILARVVKSYSALVKRNYEFTNPARSIRHLNEVKGNRNQIRDFAELVLIKDSGTIITNQEYFKVYQALQASTEFSYLNFEKTTLKSLTIELKKLGYKTGTFYIKEFNQNHRGLKGYSLNPEVLKILDQDRKE